MDLEPRLDQQDKPTTHPDEAPSAEKAHSIEELADMFITGQPPDDEWEPGFIDKYGLDLFIMWQTLYEGCQGT